MFDNTECPTCGDEIDPAYRKEAADAVEELASELRNDDTANRIQEGMIKLADWVSMVPSVPNPQPIYEQIKDMSDDDSVAQKMANSPTEAAMLALQQEGAFSFETKGTEYELKCKAHS